MKIQDVAIGMEVVDADIYEKTGMTALGVVTRIYATPNGMVEVEWQTDYLTEDVWADELQPAHI